MIKLNIDFDAFEYSNVVKHYFIDTKENKIKYINEEIEDNASEETEEMGDERYIDIPLRISQNDFSIMEGFVYELSEENFELCEKFHNALEREKPFSNFRELLEQYPKLREKWFQYKDKQMQNETIDWLCENNIELENQKLILPIKIGELKELGNLPEDLEGFKPVRCMNCKNEGRLKARFFLINTAPENLFIEKQTKRIMKEKYDINHYGHFTGGEKEMLTVSKCPKCGSEDIVWDY